MPRTKPDWQADWEAKRARQAKRQPEYRLALDVYGGFSPQPVPGDHFPDRPAYDGHRHMKWACLACGYWTGYQSKTKASKMILQHCAAKNASDGGQ